MAKRPIPASGSRFSFGTKMLIGLLILALCFIGVIVTWPSAGLKLANQIDRLTKCTNHCLTPWAYEKYYGFNPRSATGGIFKADNAEMVESWGGDKAVLPASVSKLFTIEYASTVMNLNEQVSVDAETLALVKPNSSTAKLTPGKYLVSQLYAAMLIPSGNDAAYGLAVATSRKLHGNRLSAVAALAYFDTDINKFLKSSGYSATKITDPAGYSATDTTSANDVALATSRLLKYPWLKDLVKNHQYSITTPDARSYTWVNTNEFLDPDSEFYNPKVAGVKSGSWSGWTNLVTLYHGEKADYIVIVFGSSGNKDRYRDTQTLLKVLSENHK